MLPFLEMMKKQITMPAHLMHDGENDSLFDDYAAVAQRCGVYTSVDYARIIDHLISYWNLGTLTGLSSDAQKAQDFLCRLPARIHRLAERSLNRARSEIPPRRTFSWIHNKEVDLLWADQCWGPHIVLNCRQSDSPTSWLASAICFLQVVSELIWRSNKLSTSMLEILSCKALCICNLPLDSYAELC